jgi:hypothetical protein
MRAFFDNGFGVSIIDDGYGSQSGLYELAVLKGTPDDFRLTYDTPITNDVIGWLTWEQAQAIVKEVSELCPDCEVPQDDWNADWDEDEWDAEPTEADSLALTFLNIQGDYLDGAKSV